MSTTSTGSQTAAPERQAAPAAASDQTDFSPPKTSTWSEIAGKCWQDGVKECIASAGQKFGDLFGVRSAKQQDLIKQGTIPDLTLVQSGADMRIGGTAEARVEGSDAAKALQGDNKKRTETVLNAKADPQDRLKAASELVNAGITGFTVQGSDGSFNKVRLEKESVGNGRDMLGVYVSGKSGAELNALRAIQNADGSLVQQKDGSGKQVDYKNRGVALLDRLSDSGKVVEDGTKAGGRPAPEAQDAPQEKSKREPKEGETPGEWKSPLERKYQEGDKFKGVTSVYWQDIHTASGVRFNKNELSAASREFPFGTVLKVRNPENGLETRVVITDHGPFAGKKELRPDGSEKIYNRVLDISLGAANAIGMKDKTPRAMEISVESIPENRAWGRARQNLRKDEKTALLAQVKRVTEEGRM